MTSRAIVVAGLSALMLFPQLNRGGLSGLDDALYAHEAKDMFQSGDWWNVRFNGSLNFQYPPLFFWLEAASFKLFGVNDFAAKFPAALAGLGTIIVLYFLAGELTGDGWLALASMLVLAATQPFLKYATHAMTDVPFAFFFTLAVYFHVKGLRQPWYFLPMGLAVAGAYFTRSIPGLLPLGITAVHLLLTRRGRVLYSLPWLAGCAVALALPALWLGIEYRLYGAEFLNTHLSFLANRIRGPAPGSWKPSWRMLAYEKELLKYYWPWLPFAVAGIAIQIRAAARRDSAATLPLIWLLVVLIPISLADTKYGRYLMPAFPALAMISAAGLYSVISPGRKVAAVNVGCWGLLIAAGFPLLLPSGERGEEMRGLAPMVERNSEPGRLVLFYTNGDAGYSFQNQFLWYANRHTETLTDLPKLTARLAQNGPVTGIIDGASFDKLMNQLPMAVARRIQVVARSGYYLCYRLT